jgi:hypothetical protein
MQNLCYISDDIIIRSSRIILAGSAFYLIGTSFRYNTKYIPAAAILSGICIYSYMNPTLNMHQIFEDDTVAFAIKGCHNILLSINATDAPSKRHLIAKGVSFLFVSYLNKENLLIKDNGVANKIAPYFAATFLSIVIDEQNKKIYRQKLTEDLLQEFKSFTKEAVQEFVATRFLSKDCREEYEFFKSILECFNIAREL